MRKRRNSYRGRISERNTAYRRARRLRESVSVDSIRTELADFTTDYNRIGFENANGGDFYSDYLYDFYMSDGFTATANLERMEGYFTWNSPSGNGFDLSIEYNLKSETGLNNFLSAIKENEDIDNYKLIGEVLKSNYGFKENRFKYTKSVRNSDCEFDATWDTDTFSGIIEGIDYSDGDFAQEFDDFITFIEEYEYLIK